MSPDDYQQAWQAQSARTRITIDADILLKEVQRSQKSFEATILWRDIREAGISMLMIPVWLLLGFMLSLPWTWYLMLPTLVWVSGFIIVDRTLNKQKPCELNDSLLGSVKESLTQVEHQIRLLRNVFWWYLLPSAIPILAFFAHTAWLTSKGDWFVALSFAGTLSFLRVPSSPTHFSSVSAYLSLQSSRDRFTHSWVSALNFW